MPQKNLTVFIKIGKVKKSNRGRLLFALIIPEPAFLKLTNMTYYIEAWRKKEGEFILAEARWTERRYLNLGISNTKDMGHVTICYFKVTLKQ